MGVRHKDKKAIDLVSREWASSGTSFAQGQCGGGGGFAPNAVVSAFMFLCLKQGLRTR